MSGQFFTYTSNDPNVPEQFRHVCGLLIPGKPFVTWWTAAASPEAAEAKLRAFWEDEKRRHGYGEKKPRKKAASPSTPADDPGDVI